MASKDLAALYPHILEPYYADNAKKLHSMVDQILYKFGGLSGKDLDDFYSLANEVFVDALKRYDCEQSFDGFLYACLSNKIKSEVTKRNREKRRADRMSVSLDATNDSGEEYSLLDCIASDFDTYEEVSKRQKNGAYCDKVQQYISRLSTRQANILSLLVNGYKPHEIQRILEISPKEYTDSMQILKSYEKIKYLF